VSEDQFHHESSPSPRRHRRRRISAAQTMGAVLFGFEQQVWRTAPPREELVHHARPNAPVPAGDGTMLTIEFPGDAAQHRQPLDDEGGVS
jgi:hypothetical protein